MTSIEWKNATPEQHNLWKHASGLIAFTTITPIHYSGLLPGSEFITYNAAKLYIGLQVEFIATTLVSVAAISVISYNMANAVQNYYMCVSAFWDTTAAAAKFVSSAIREKNVWFSRVTSGMVDYICFNGYRLTV